MLKTYKPASLPDGSSSDITQPHYPQSEPTSTALLPLLFTMKFLAIAAVLAATAFGTPIVEESDVYVSPSGLKVRGIGNRGDGYYLAAFNEDKVADIEFTPFSMLNNAAMTETTNATAVAGELAARGTLSKRGSTTCSGLSGYQPDMDEANIQLANNAHGKTYQKGDWGWVRTIAFVLGLYLPQRRAPLSRLWLTLTTTGTS